jgi:hypothetical protein
LPEKFFSAAAKRSKSAVAPRLMAPKVNPVQNTQLQGASKTSAWAIKDPKMDVGPILSSVQTNPTNRYLFGTISAIPAYYNESGVNAQIEK